MGKARRQRLNCAENGLSAVNNNDKISLTSNQLKDLINRVRIAQMKQDGVSFEEIIKQSNCGRTMVAKWQNINFDDPRNFVVGSSSGRSEVSRKIEKIVLTAQ